MAQVSRFPLSAGRALWVGRIRHEARRQWSLSGYVLYLWRSLGVHLLAWELAQDLKILVGFQICTDRVALEPCRKEGGAPSRGRAGWGHPSVMLTGIVGDVRLSQVPAGNPWWLGFAEVFDELGLGHR